MTILRRRERSPPYLLYCCFTAALLLFYYLHDNIEEARALAALAINSVHVLFENVAIQLRLRRAEGYSRIEP
jgi:hypothetical protein